MLDNLVDGKNLEFWLSFMTGKRRKILGVLKRYTKSEIISLGKGVELSKRSYRSYYTLLGMFLLIMVPVSILTTRMIKRRLQEN